MATPSHQDPRLYEIDGSPPVLTATPLALQHVLAAIVGCITPAIMVANAANLPQDGRVILIQAALVTAALSTLLQLYPIGGGRFRFGAKLPVIMGISFAYVPTMQGIASGTGVAAIAGAMVVGGLVALIVGFFIKRVRRFFPPIVAGTVVFTIGLSLYMTAINYMAGGVANTLESVVARGLPKALVYGSWQNWLIALITLAVTVALGSYAKGLLKLSAILVGMAVGYLIAMAFGMVDFSGIATAGWVAAPNFLPFGMQFDPVACTAIGLLFAINSIQALGDFTATTVGGVDREPTDRELSGGIMGYGLTNLVMSLLGGLPTATYSQNVGIVSTTKVVSRKVFALAAGVLLLAGLFPKFAAALTTIPQCVLGGATLTVFSTIAISGVKLVTAQPLTPRTTTVVGLSVALGMGVSQASGSISGLPQGAAMILGQSPVVLTTLLAVFLNLILPPENDAADGRKE